MPQKKEHKYIQILEEDKIYLRADSKTKLNSFFYINSKDFKPTQDSPIGYGKEQP